MLTLGICLILTTSTLLANPKFFCMDTENIPQIVFDDPGCPDTLYYIIEYSYDQFPNIWFQSQRFNTTQFCTNGGTRPCRYQCLDDFSDPTDPEYYTNPGVTLPIPIHKFLDADPGELVLMTFRGRACNEKGCSSVSNISPRTVPSLWSTPSNLRLVCP